MAVYIKRLLAVGLFLMLCSGLMGCGAPEADTGTENPESTESAESVPQEESQEPGVVSPEDPSRMEVYVVCEEDVTVRDKPYEDYSYSTIYEYDAKGCVDLAFQESDAAEGSTNLCRTDYVFDDNNRLTEVSNAFEQYDWNVGNEYTFTYDDQGRCDTGKFEIVSEGIGNCVVQYTYDENGRIATGLATNESTPAEEPVEATLTWSYLDDGHIQSVVSDNEAFASLFLDDDASDINRGKYVYVDNWGTTIELNYDADGLLVLMRRISGDYIEERTFDYAVISVDRESYIPSICSNPTGFDLLYAPQVIK